MKLKKNPKDIKQYWLYNLMIPYSRHLLFSLLTINLSFLLITGCDNPGSVGSDLTETPADVSIDTLSIGDVDVENYNAYSGALEYISAGLYQDALFGDISATALIKPALPSSDDIVASDATVLMSLVLDEGHVYGDSLATQDFSLYEITEPWRSKERRVQDSVSFSEDQPQSFSFADTDSITVELPQEWVDRYREYANSSNEDSAYVYEEYGFALVPENSSKILSLNRSATNFIVQNPEADTFTVSATEGAYNLERNNAGNIPEGSLPLHSTLESVLTFSLDDTEFGVQPSGISKAELLFYRDNTQPDEQRTEGKEVNLHILNPNAGPDEIDLNSPVAAGEYSGSDEAYHFEITTVLQQYLYNGLQEGDEFVISFPNDGELKSSLIYTASDQVAEDKQPKIVITSLKNSSN